ncbi:MAG: NAD(+) synthase [Clostridia bacterium]|nr:NAD(+) synthase [Clostridia bacterium]
MRDGYIKVASATPTIKLADTVFNTKACIDLATRASEAGVKVLVFPELTLTGYSCGDLFNTETLLNGALDGLREYILATAMFDMISVIGLPILYSDKIYNCAAVVSGGQLLGLVPKKNLPNHTEYFEMRAYTPAPDDNFAYVFDDSVVIFGLKQMFVCRQMPSLRIGVEICEDIWVFDPPSNALAAAGATIIANPSASSETVGKEDYRRSLVKVQSTRTMSGYIYASLGLGESTSSSVCSGHCMIFENGSLLAERKPFEFDAGDMVISEIDLQKIVRARRACNTFSKDTKGNEYSDIEFDLCEEKTELTRLVDPHPFTPSDKTEMARNCETILTIQSQALAHRITSSYSKNMVVGISGGLDSCLALLVMVRAADYLKIPRKNIIAVTMPCFGTTARTKNNATVLCERLGVDFRCVDIFDSVNQHFKDIGHDPSDHSVVYENAQARERTQVLMDIANKEGGIVVGTGDLSELALGWATYNGDHMSMYGVNASVPKTLIRHVVRHYADIERQKGDDALADAIYDIIDTPVSPELLPADKDGKIAQKTEDLVGPYELHDFYIYNFVKYGFTPRKIFRLAKIAFDGRYDDQTLLKWLEVFTKRFFSQQFKRSCMPDGPKVGSVSLSSADWRMPSDATSAIWLKEIAEIRSEL